ncbi:MAG: ABC transporter permease [Rhodobacteraceae bacterium]|nr:ABC transporter permease [Paracoccaceae bacterium]
MLKFFIDRVFQGIIVLLAVSFLAFLMFRFLGDPILAIAGADSTAEQRAAIRESLGLDAPLLLQYLDYLRNIVTGQFGISYRLGEPVTRVILDRAPATIELAVASMILTLVIGVGAGIYTALHPRSAVSKGILAVSLAGISMPSFFLGVLMIYFFSVQLHWLPSFGRGSLVAIGGWETGFLTGSGLLAMIMPSITLAVFQIAMVMRLVRAEMIEVLQAEFIRFARARGLNARRINLRHALGNTLVPVITVVGLQLGSTIGFAVVTETVFQWPGLGLLFTQSVEAVDVPVLAAFLMFIALVFVVINLVIDLLYYLIDPRLRVDAKKA